jgi:chromosome segregation ATPase
MTQSGNNFGATNNSSNAASLKGKLQSLEDAIQQVAEEMNTHKKDVTSLKNEKDTLQEILKLKTHEVKTTLVQELNKVEEEMKRHFSHQKAENSRLQQQISLLKTEKTVLQNQLIALQRRITDLEMQVGNDDVKYA